MKKMLEFVKTTILGGLVAIVPLAVLLVALGMALKVLIDISTVLKDVLPFAPLVNTAIVFGVAVIALVVICFGAGLMVKTAFGHAFVERVHTFFSKHMPLYKTVREITRNAAGMQGREFDLALIDLHGSPSRVLGTVMEELPDNRVAVYVPMSPTLESGRSMSFRPRMSRGWMSPSPTSRAPSRNGEWGPRSSFKCGPARCKLSRRHHSGSTCILQARHRRIWHNGGREKA